MTPLQNNGGTMQNRVQNTLPTVQITATAPYQNKVDGLVVMLECDTSSDRPLRERLADAASGLAGLVTLRAVAVVAEVRPVRQDVPAAVTLRRALKKLRRDHGLRASWSSPPPRPARRKTKRNRKATASATIDARAPAANAGAFSASTPIPRLEATDDAVATV